MTTNAHLAALQEAWWHLRRATEHVYWDLTEGDEYEGRAPMPGLIAAICAPWGPLAYRFKWYNLEKLFRPLKAERRETAHWRQEYIFVCGGAEMTEAEWAEADALSAEFGVDMPPRDWKPFGVIDTVGTIMGMSPDEIAAVKARHEAEA